MIKFSVFQAVEKAGCLSLIISPLWLSACSPYLYKDEIAGFHTGVEQLAGAYAGGMESLVADRIQKNKWTWIKDRPELVPTGGCNLGVAGAQMSSDPCALHPVAQSVPIPSKTEQQIPKAMDVFDALEAYSAGLTAITNAADRKAFDAAQIQLKTAIQNAAAVASNNDAAANARLGAFAGLFADISGAYLDSLRYQTLLDGTKAAQPAIEVLGKVSGEYLDGLRFVRGQELFNTIQKMRADIGPTTNPSDYGVRVDLLQGNIFTLEKLRKSNPKKTAQAMVEAHKKLLAALDDKNRQAGSIIAEVTKFVNEATAVRKAFNNKPQSN